MLIQVHCYNQYQNLRSHTLKDTTDFLNFIEKKKVEKPNVSCFGPTNA